MVEMCICLSLCRKYMARHNYWTPSFKWHNLVSIRFILNEHFRQYNRGNAESANLKIICLLIKCSLLAAVLRDTSRSAARSL